MIDSPGIEITLRVRKWGVVLLPSGNRYNPDSTEIKDKGSGHRSGKCQAAALKLLYCFPAQVIAESERGLVPWVSLELNLTLMLRCIAVDDEPLALHLLTDYYRQGAFFWSWWPRVGMRFEAAKVLQEKDVGPGCSWISRCRG